MKQFEKFFTRVMIPRIKANTLIYKGTFEDDCEKTWRSALQWVITKLEPDLEDWEQDFLDEIKEELKGT